MFKPAGRVVFSLCLAMLVGAMLYMSTQLGPVSRFAPIRVAIPTLGLLLVQLLIDIKPALAQRRTRSRLSQPSGVEPDLNDTAVDGRIDLKGGPSSSDQLTLILWMFALLLLIYMLGFVVAAPLYTVLYLRFRSTEGWTTSMTAAAAMWSVVYLVFGMLLKTQLYEGQLWGWLNL